MRKTIAIALSLFAAWAFAPLSAEQVMTYQGRLKESGVPFTGVRSFDFKLCNAETGGGCSGTPSGAQTFAVQNGLFRSTFTIPAVDLSAGPWYLEISVDGSALSPRERLTAVPYSVYAGSASYAPSAVQKSGDIMTGGLRLEGSTLTVTGNAFSVGGSTFVVKNGYVGIGTATPPAPLAVYDTDQYLFAGNTSANTATINLVHTAGGSARLNDNSGAAAAVALSINHVDYLRLSHEGNIGISSITPSYRLVVSSGAGEAGNMVVISTGGSSVVRMTGAGEVYANYFHGDGSYLTNVPVNAGAVIGTLSVADGGTGATTEAGARASLGVVSLSGDTMTGPLVIGADTSVNSYDLTTAGLQISTSGAVMTRGMGTGALAPGARGYGAIDLQNYRSDSTQVASGARSVITGGMGNSASGAMSVVSGGGDNAALGNSSVVPGGASNKAEGDYSAVGGGAGNVVYGQFSVIGGGNSNSAAAMAAAVGGGDSNMAGGDYSFVGGGNYNIAAGSNSVIAGGATNILDSTSSVIAGGEYNSATGMFSVVGGGARNAVSGASSSIGGGDANSVTDTMGHVGGGRSNVVSGPYAVISGGGYNNASGFYSVVTGGSSNNAAGTYSLAAGFSAYSAAAGAFTWSDSAGFQLTNAVADRTVFKNRGGFLVTGSTQTALGGLVDRGFYVSGSGMAGIATSSPQAALDVVAAGAAHTDMAQIWRTPSGTIVSSVSATGVIQAAHFVGDGTGLTGVTAGAFGGVLGVAQGGTGQTTAAGALSALGGLPASGGNMTGPLTFAASSMTVTTGGAVRLDNDVRVAWRPETEPDDTYLTGNRGGSYIKAVLGGTDALTVSPSALTVPGDIHVTSVAATGNISAARYMVGVSTMLAVLPGIGSIAVGIDAGRLDTAINNTFVGHSAGYLAQGGQGNTYIGSASGYNGNSGQFNSVVGEHALMFSQTGSYNAIVGAQAGYGALNNSYNNSALMGYQAGYALTTGSGNTLLGFKAGDTLTDGGGNIVIGYMQDSSGPSASSELNIGGILFGSMADKTIGISTRTPQAALDVVSTGTLPTEYAQIWRNSGGTIVSSVSATGVVSASGFVGNGSGLSGLPMPPGALSRYGDTMAGQLTVYGSTLTVISPDSVISSLWVSTSLVTPQLYLSTAGRMGLGTASPGGTLSVGPAIGVGMAYPSVLVSNPSGNSGVAAGKSASNNIYMGWNSGGNYGELSTLGGALVLNGSNQNVGIGAANPQAHLSMHGTGTFYTMFISTASDGSSPNLVVANSGYVGISSAAPASPLQVGDTLLSVGRGGQVNFHLGGEPASDYVFYLKEDRSSAGLFYLEGQDGGVLRADTFFGNTNLDNMYSAGNMFIGRDMTGGGAVHIGPSATRSVLVVPAEGSPYAGNVGIGTTQPGYYLHVSSGAGEAGTIMAVSTGATNLFWVSGNGAHAPSFYGDGSNLTGINATSYSGTLPVGNGGTGATTLTGVLRGNGSSAMTAMTGTAGYATRWTSANVIGTGILQDNGSNASVGTSPSSALLQVGADTYSGGPLFSVGGSTLTAMADGKVGIGTGAPTALLDVIDAKAQSPYVLKVGTSSLASLVVTTGGVVGIGTMYPSTQTVLDARATLTDRTSGIEDIVTGISGATWARGAGEQDAAVGGDFRAVMDGIQDLRYLAAIHTQLEWRDFTGGTLQNAVQLYMDTPVTSGGGLINNSYGLFISTLTGGNLLNAPYAIYSEDPNARTYFAGKVGISSASPSYALSVSSAPGSSDVILAVSTGAVNVFTVSGAGEVRGGKFYGDAGGLTNLPLPPTAVSRYGDTISGPLTLTGSSLTVTSGAWMLAGNATAYALVAGGYEHPYSFFVTTDGVTGVGDFTGTTIDTHTVLQARALLVDQNLGVEDIRVGVSGHVATAGSGSEDVMAGGNFEATVKGLDNAYMAAGVRAKVRSEGTGALGRAIGLFVDDVQNDAGTITDTYGIYIGTQTGTGAGVQTNTPYSIFAADPNGLTYLNGKVSIGRDATDPDAALYVNGSIKMSYDGALYTGAYPVVAWNSAPVFGHKDYSLSLLAGAVAPRLHIYTDGVINMPAQSAVISSETIPTLGTMGAWMQTNPTTVSDTQGEMTSGVFTAKYAGSYLVTYGATGDTTGTGIYFGVGVGLNGAAPDRVSMAPLMPSFTSGVNLSTVYSLTAGSVLRFYYYTTSTTPAVTNFIQVVTINKIN